MVLMLPGHPAALPRGKLGADGGDAPDPQTPDLEDEPPCAEEDLVSDLVFFNNTCPALSKIKLWREVCQSSCDQVGPKFRP